MKLELYTPHKNQIKIHESTAMYRVVVAGRRFGKSALALNEALARAIQVKEQVIWIILPQLKQAKEIYWKDPKLTKYYMPYVASGVLEMNRSDLYLRCKKTNSWSSLKGSDNYDSLRGAGLNLIIWDEIADVKEEAFDVIEPSLADSPNHRVLYVGTPKGLNWFHDFALRGDHKNVIPDFGKPIQPDADWQTWHFSSYDNAAWSAESRERISFVKYIDSKKIEAEEKGRLAFWMQEWMASFEESAGRFFPVWAYSTHVYPDKIIPQEQFEVFESMDWGRTAPFAWYLHIRVPVNYEGQKFNRIYTIAEIYGSGKSPFEWAKEIVEMRKKYQIESDRVKFIAIDPSMSDPLVDGSASIKDQFNNAFEQLI